MRSKIQQIAENLREVAQRWEDIVEDVQNELSELDEDVPSSILELYAKIRELEPDLTPPQSLRDFADDMDERASWYPDGDEE